MPLRPGASESDTPLLSADTVTAIGRRSRLQEQQARGGFG